jgi:hypothetical protein
MNTVKRRDVVLEKGFDEWYGGARIIRSSLRNAKKPYDSIDIAEDAFYAGADVERKRSNEQLQKIIIEIEKIESKIPKSQSLEKASEILRSLKEATRKTIKTNSFVEAPPIICEEPS